MHVYDEAISVPNSEQLITAFTFNADVLMCRLEQFLHLDLAPFISLEYEKGSGCYIVYACDFPVE